MQKVKSHEEVRGQAFAHGRREAKPYFECQFRTTWTIFFAAFAAVRNEVRCCVFQTTTAINTYYIALKIWFCFSATTLQALVPLLVHAT